MEIPWARHGKSLLPQIFRISKEGNAEHTAGDKHFYAVGKSGCIKQITRDGGWFLRRTADQQYQSSRPKVKETCGFFMTRRWILSSDQPLLRASGVSDTLEGQPGLFWGTACRGWLRRTSLFRKDVSLEISLQADVQTPLHSENFKLILKVMHVLWVLPEAKIGRWMKAEMYGTAGISGRSKNLRWGANKMLIIIQKVSKNEEQG